MRAIEFDCEQLEEKGAVRIDAALDSAALVELAPLFDRVGPDRPGTRIAVSDIGATKAVECARELARHIDPRMKPVRALLFDKRAGCNWAVAWHQDRTITVVARHECEGFGPWTIKDGRPHVAPPVSLLADMLTMRLHLDPVKADNAPLIVASGSHRLGLVPEDELGEAIRRADSLSCLADAGDIWVYRTLVLHASERAAHPRRRRVLQLDFSPSSLPEPLAWAN